MRRESLLFRSKEFIMVVVVGVTVGMKVVVVYELMIASKF